MPRKVIVLGGGVAGMSAAHELCERGFAVAVFELKDIPGGKARSIPVPGSGTRRNIGTVHLGRLAADGQRALPGEHGFRFFAGFYRHLVDTMQRIPHRGGSCADNLVQTARTELARFGGASIELPTRLPRSLAEVWALRTAIAEVFDPDLGIAGEEYDAFARLTWQIFTSCEERRNEEYEKLSWWDFIGAEGRSETYQMLFGRGGTQSLVAARARLASTKTVGNVYLQYFFNVAGSGADRVLNGPTNDVWIRPWLTYLKSRGVEYHLGSRVRSINCGAGRVRGVTIERLGKRSEVVGDYYVAALPVDVMATLVSDELIRADPGLANIIALSKNVASQNGIQFYLTEDAPANPGHVVYVDSPWALTSVSQKQFWPDVDLRQYADGRVRDIISVDISDWDTPGLNGKPARECTREEIRDEVWEELKRSLNAGDANDLRDEHLHSWFLDPDVDPTTRVNSEPLLVNLVDTWRLRSEAVTRIPNLFLASDYVRTYTDLACMEGANEAARRAVNGIIAAAGVAAPPCQLWKLHEPEWLEPWRAHDRARFQRGLPWDDALLNRVLPILDLVQRVSAELDQRLDDTLGVGAQGDALRPYLRFAQSLPDLVARWANGDSGQIGELMRALMALIAKPPGSSSGPLDGSPVAAFVQALAASPRNSTPGPQYSGLPDATANPAAARNNRVRFVDR